MRPSIDVSDPENLADYQGCSCTGHPITYWPGWQNNDARFSVQTDINPLPITPVHFQNWPEMNFQLSNGWQYTNYGQRMPYDDYLRMLFSSTSSPGAPAPMRGQGQQPTANGLVSQKTLQNTMLAPQTSTGSGGAGTLNAPLGRRTFYG
jgi:hypothetical protein